MCGIIGLVNFYGGDELVSKGLKILENRGKDYSQIKKLNQIIKKLFLGIIYTQ